MAKVSTTDALKYAATLAYSIYVLLHSKVDSAIGILLLIANLRASDYLLFDGQVIRSVYKNLKLSATLKMPMGLFNALRLLPKLAIVAALVMYVHPLRLAALDSYFRQADHLIALRGLIGLELSGLLAPFTYYVALPVYALDYFVLDNLVLSKIKARVAALLARKSAVAARKRRN
jgi:hypothetical protein